MSKINILELAQVLIDKNGLSKEDAETFVKQMFDIAGKALDDERLLKIRGLGTFKLNKIKDRESIDVNTGERIVIEGRDKIIFTPDTTLKDIVNKPFSQFETVIVNDGTDVSELETVDEGTGDNQSENVVDNKIEGESTGAEDSDNNIEDESINVEEPDNKNESEDIDKEEVVSDADTNKTDGIKISFADTKEEIQEDVIADNNDSVVITNKDETSKETSDEESEPQSHTIDFKNDANSETIEVQKDENTDLNAVENNTDDIEDNTANVEGNDVGDNVNATEINEQSSDEVVKEDSDSSEEIKSNYIADNDDTKLADDSESVSKQDDNNQAIVSDQVESDENADAPENSTNVSEENTNSTEEDANSADKNTTIQENNTATSDEVSIDTEKDANAKEENDIDTEDSTPDEDNEEVVYLEDEEVTISKKMYYIGIGAIFALLCGLGYFIYKYNQVSSEYDKLDATLTALASKSSNNSAQSSEKEKSKEDSANLLKQQKAIDEAEKAKAEDEKNSSSEDDVDKEQSSKSNSDVSSNDEDDYNKDVRVRTGAYRIVGIDKVVTAKSGQTLSSISRIYLGSGMECYVEAVNGKDISAGQKVKIPKLKLKKRRR